MISSDFISRYTTALYSTPKECAPTYDEFRDMFSTGQIRSKEWLIDELYKLDIPFTTVAIAGAWYGTLGHLIKSQFISSKIVMIDSDPRCKVYVDNISQDGEPYVQYVTEDMYAYEYSEDIVINTSCEHISDVMGWVSMLPIGTIVILQSNNFIGGKDHINCVHSKDEFIHQSGLSKILYSGELVMSMYTRYMIIGVVGE